MHFAIPVEVYIAMPYVLAVLLAVALPFASFIEYRLASGVSPETRLAVVLVVVGIGALLAVALTSRTLNEAQLVNARPAYEDYEEGFAASRWLTLLLLGAAFGEIVRGWLRARSSPIADEAKPILIAFMLFYLGTIVIQAIASDETGFSYKAVYVPVLLAAVYYQRVEHLDRVISWAKWVILVLSVGSLLMAAYKPDFVLHRPEPGVIPGIDWRLFGLTPHANTLGPIALLAILLEFHSPSKLKFVRYAHLLTASAVFVLAQSKTAWGAAVAIAAIVYVPLAMSRRSGVARGSSADFRRATWTLVACILAIIVLAAATVVLETADVVRLDVDLDTLTGRTQIWEITLKAWRDNVLFGYGPEIWGIRRRLQFNMFHVGQAHNQVVQTLGEAGLFGLALLLGYLSVLLLAALRFFTASKGIVLSLLILLLVRCVTEAPMRSEGLLSWATFLQVLLLVFACHFMRMRSPATAAGHGVRDGGHRHPAAAYSDTLPNAVSGAGGAPARGWT